jgi:hypothetical protein
MTVLGGDALGMKLDSVHWKRAMGKTHYQSVIGLGRHHEIRGQSSALNHE